MHNSACSGVFTHILPARYKNPAIPNRIAGFFDILVVRGGIEPPDFSESRRTKKPSNLAKINVFEGNFVRCRS
jgi:hypothetical protein